MNEFISRDEAYQQLHDAGGCDATEEWEKGYDDGITEAIRIINEMPAADVAPVVHGKWAFQYSSTDPKPFYSFCSHYREPIKSTRAYHIYKFCPHCGAKMDESEDNNNE